MFNDTVKQSLVAMVAAAILTVTAVGAAVGPAVGDTAPVRTAPAAALSA